MDGNFTGLARKDRKTKLLVKSLQHKEIAVIDHRDIDEVSAKSLIALKVRVVLNARDSISGKYPNQGPLQLVQAGILLIDCLGEEFFMSVQDEDNLTISGNEIYRDNVLIAAGRLLNEEKLHVLMEAAKDNIEQELDDFVKNTLVYAQKERELIFRGLIYPEISTKIRNRHVLIVVRGKNYQEDLNAIKSYIREKKPVLIGVDGGADALIENGYRPDIIIGDMDSITDSALKGGAEIIVHAYTDGSAPGLERIESLGLKAKTFPAPGTSEDIAMLLGYEYGARLIVAVGAHSNLIDFLEKGRKGMGSTFLVRLKVGSVLVDAKGVAELHNTSIKKRYFIVLLMSAIIPVLIVMANSPSISQYLKLFLMKIRIILGIY